MKILVSDFDNTFFTKNILENIKMVNKYRNRGNIFIIATGRPIYLLKPELDKYKIKYDYLICNDGAVIFDSDNNIIDKTNIDYKTTIQIYNYLVRDNNLEHLCIDAITDFGSLESKDYNGILALPYDKELAIPVIKNINKKYSNVQAYMSHKWINVLSINASKGNAINYLINLNKWDTSKLYTIGDNTNDISMTNFNSYGIKNGKEEYLKKCKKVVNNFKEMMVDINESD